MTKATNNTIIRIGGLVIAALLVKNLFTNIFGPNEPDTFIDNPPGEEQNPSITIEQARIIADRIDQAIYSDSTFWSGGGFGSLFENEQKVIQALTDPTLTRNADVLLVADAYGIRGRFLTPDLNMVQAVRYYLADDQVETINLAWSGRGMTIRI